ncbi:LysM peptidoglycan-binding domain-containing protein [Anaeromicropila populeti]|uniref:Spore germination protein n=1 Tax=Anaeromicropila populeti TaxID=37658 RepID=A0A1I6IKX1_9FIRM|nr:LysM peptidoglycan-binding domain-containing protein [Anaeromicropila populeti]SFR67417.1 spore germination protein [Anaeromicropila populeti]
MEIYVVKQGDTLQSIADKFGFSVQKLIQDNGLEETDYLIIGQTLVIAHPQQVYTIKQGDTLLDIANKFNVSIIQILANNPELSDREYIYPGDTIIISYNTDKGKIITHGNTDPNINKDILRKTLPYLTYLSVLNFTATKEGEIITYYDDNEVIQIAKDYGVAPLMMLTTATLQGEANILTTFDILLNEDFQNRIIDNILRIIETKGYYGINISFQYINISNLHFYENYLTKITNRLSEEGYQVFLNVNPNVSLVNNEVFFEKVDYTRLNQSAQNIIFTTYEWAERIMAPSPISSFYSMENFINYILNYIPPDKIIIGIATIGYDWELPYAPKISNVNSLSFEGVIDLARSAGAVINYDEVSQTPYFRYTFGNNLEHVVWYINSRSINATMELVSKYNLSGISVWNIRVFNPQLWLIISSQYEIEKILY